MTAIEKARAFAALHVPGDPVILYNAWDAGSAKVVAEAGAKALATGSASVAGAQGFADAESLPLDLALANAERRQAGGDRRDRLQFRGPGDRRRRHSSGRTAGGAHRGDPRCGRTGFLHQR